MALIRPPLAPEMASGSPLVWFWGARKKRRHFYTIYSPTFPPLFDRPFRVVDSRISNPPSFPLPVPEVEDVGNHAVLPGLALSP